VVPAKEIRYLFFNIISWVPEGHEHHEVPF